MEKPKIKKRDGFTLVDAIVGLDLGLCARPSATISKECSKYPKKIYFQKSIYHSTCPYLDYLKCPAKAILPEKYDCKSILNLMETALEKGARARISVEGEDEEAERWALRMYSAIIGDDICNLDFDRFEEEKE